MSLKDFLKERVERAREYAVVEKPVVRAWVWEGQLYMLGPTRLVKLGIAASEDVAVEIDMEASNRTDCQEQQCPCVVLELAGPLVGSAVFGDRLYLLLQPPLSPPVVTLVPLANPQDRSVLYTGNDNSEVSWIFCARGKNLRQDFFEDMGSSDLNAVEQLFIIVGTSCQVICFPEENSWTILRRQIRFSKIEFLQKYLTVNREHERVTRFQCLANLLEGNTSTSMDRVFLQRDLKDVALVGQHLVLLENGCLWLYTAGDFRGRNKLLSHVQSFTVVNSTLTVTTDADGVYYGTMSDFVNCSKQPSPSHLLTKGDFIERMFSLSRTVKQVGILIQQEKQKLEQLRILSSLLDSRTLFDVHLSIGDKLNFFGSDRKCANLQLTFNCTESILLKEFFALKISCTTQQVSEVTMVSFTKNITYMDSIMSELNLPRISSLDFPVFISGDLILLGDSISGCDETGSLIGRAEVFRHSIPPLALATVIMSHSAPTRPALEPTGDERTRFLSLLDTEDSAVLHGNNTSSEELGHGRNMHSRCVEVSLSCLKNNGEKVVCDLVRCVEEEGRSLRIQFLSQEVQIHPCKISDNRDRVRLRVSCADRSSVHAIANDLKRYIILQQPL